MSGTTPIPVILRRSETSIISKCLPHNDHSKNFASFFENMTIAKESIKHCIFCRALHTPSSIDAISDIECKIKFRTYNLIWPSEIRKSYLDSNSVLHHDMLEYYSNIHTHFSMPYNARFIGLTICSVCDTLFLSPTSFDHAVAVHSLIGNLATLPQDFDRTMIIANGGSLPCLGADHFELDMEHVYQRSLFQFRSHMNITLKCSKKRTLPAKSEPEPKKPAKEPEIEQHSVVSDKGQSFVPQTVPYEDKYNQLLEEDLPLEGLGF